MGQSGEEGGSIAMLATKVRGQRVRVGVSFKGLARLGGGGRSYGIVTGKKKIRQRMSMQV